MPDTEIHIIDASGAGPLDWAMVAEEFHQARLKGIKAIELKIPDNQKYENIQEFINSYCATRNHGLSAEEISSPLNVAEMIMKNTRKIVEALRARPGAPSRGGDRG